MSRGEHQTRKSITWTDESGRSYTDTWRTNRGHSPGAIPAELRLVDIADGAGHLIAVLMRSDSAAPPLLYVHGAGAPRPMLALTDDGLVAVMVTYDNDGRGHAGTLGTPRPTFEIGCPICSTGFDLRADELRNLAETRGRRARRLVV